MIELCDSETCCGCTACASICPRHAIEMVPDVEGFLQPKINPEKCIECGLCQKSCPILAPLTRENGDGRSILAIQNKNDYVRRNSPAGGFFSVLASSFVEKTNGFVSGAIFDKNFCVKHSITNEKNKLAAFSGSKYVQSDLRGIFQQIASLLKDGQNILFSGTPCQIHGLKKFLRKPYSNLLTVELVCHGVPSPLLWEEYKKFQENKYKSPVIDVNFRHKKFGYRSSSLMLRFANGKQYNGSHDSDYWLRAFTQNHALRWSCYKCPFKGNDRVSDFTIYDGWHIGMWNRLMNDDKGTTVVMLNTENAKKWFDIIKNNMNCQSVNKNDIWVRKDAIKLYECSNIGTCRHNLYTQIVQNGYAYTVQKLFPITIKLKIKILIKKILGALGFMSILGKLKSLR